MTLLVCNAVTDCLPVSLLYVKVNARRQPHIHVLYSIGICSLPLQFHVQAEKYVDSMLLFTMPWHVCMDTHLDHVQ